METIRNGQFDEERAFYAKRNARFEACRFDGPADGESALKECRNVRLDDCFFNLRYPFWHDHSLVITGSVLTELCRAAIWYSDHIQIRDTTLGGIKALRECSDVMIQNSRIDSPEFGWSVKNITMEDTEAVSEYFMMRSENLHFRNVKFKGKYSFQYITNAVFENCEFDTKDAFWHGKNILVKNCLVKGEYLGWYSENVTFDHCTIIGTQPLCYCRKLTLIDCQMIDTDLAFERSGVDASITTSVISIKNPLKGLITAPEIGEIIRDIEGADGIIEITGQEN